jgi:terminal uridylyltransferase
VSALKSSGKFSDIVSITSAKVPIVKFRNRKPDIEGDISLYNGVAVYNTDLLATYSSMDPRVKVSNFIARIV